MIAIMLMIVINFMIVMIIIPIIKVITSAITNSNHHHCYQDNVGVFAGKQFEDRLLKAFRTYALEDLKAKKIADSSAGSTVQK